MEYLKSIFEIGIQSWLDFIIKTSILFALSAIVLWLVYIVIVKLTSKKTKLHRDFFLRIQFLWSLFVLFLLLNVYWFFLIKINGIHAFDWLSYAFYLDISSQIIIYLSVIIIFVISLKKYKTFLKK